MISLSSEGPPCSGGERLRDQEPPLSDRCLRPLFPTYSWELSGTPHMLVADHFVAATFLLLPPSFPGPPAGEASLPHSPQCPQRSHPHHTHLHWHSEEALESWHCPGSTGAQRLWPHCILCLKGQDVPFPCLPSHGKLCHLLPERGYSCLQSLSRSH